MVFGVQTNTITPAAPSAHPHSRSVRNDTLLIRSSNSDSSECTEHGAFAAAEDGSQQPAQRVSQEIIDPSEMSAKNADEARELMLTMPLISDRTKTVAAYVASRASALSVPLLFDEVSTGAHASFEAAAAVMGPCRCVQLYRDRTPIMTAPCTPAA